MSKSGKSLVVIASAVTPLLLGASFGIAGVTIKTYTGTVTEYSGSTGNAPSGGGGPDIGVYWPTIAGGNAPTSAVGFNPIITAQGAAGNVPAVGSPDNNGQTEVTEQVGSGVFSVLAQTFTVGATGFNLGEIAFAMSGGGDAGTNDESIHLFQLSSAVTAASTSYTLSADEVGGDLLGGGSGDTFSFNGGNGGIEQFVFSGSDEVSLLPNTLYAVELWVDQNSGSVLNLIRPSGSDSPPYPYTGGQAYFVSAGTDAGQSEASSTVRGEVAGATRDLLFAIYAGLPNVNSTWTNMAGNESWTAAGNWSSGIPGSNPADVATFGQAIPSATIITLDANQTVGTMNFNTGSSYTIAQGTGNNTLTLNNNGSIAQINDLFGNHTISAPVFLTAGVQIAVGQPTDTFTISGNISGSGGVVLLGSNSSQAVGTVVLGGANTYAGGTTVNTGTLVVGAVGALPTASALTIGTATTDALVQLGAGTGVETLSSLTINSGSTLDVNNNHIIISYAAGTQAAADAAVRAYLVSGYNGGAWNGTGMESTAANALFTAGNTHYGLGYADGADMNGSSPVVPGLGAGNIEVKYTLYGDANLDGVVNGTDFGILAAHFGDQVTAWDEGDFNYDGVVNGSDFGALAANFGQQANGTAEDLPAADYAALDAFAAANGLLADVPEPASLGLVTLGAIGILARRRRNNPG
jgi:fibronectin-binding autotransporter adhesin